LGPRLHVIQRENSLRSDAVTAPLPGMTAVLAHPNASLAGPSEDGALGGFDDERLNVIAAQLAPLLLPRRSTAGTIHHDDPVRCADEQLVGRGVLVVKVPAVG